MKFKWRWLVTMLIVGLMVTGSLVGLGQSRYAKAATKGNRTLIIYFSMSGTTKQAAQQIQKYTGADIVRLQRATPYPKGYDNYAKVADRERRQGTHPAIKRNLPNLSRYDTVLIGFPTWWQQPPMVIHTLFDDYDFSGKTIIPFTTSMSTPMKNSMSTMRQIGQADGATVKNGFRYDDNNAALKKFLRKNHLLKSQQ
ncbi:flavodoxin [Limosilactobacillus caecicola]|uniref:flavodoxin n=1 Tax=Limosilactobacillus caecicola TaxID=2941332 RepID=UPI00203B736A|nr:flavodoxin [Limosilactobacillus caecicola]